LKFLIISGAVWEEISEELIDLIKKLLCPEDERLNARAAFMHPWFSLPMPEDTIPEEVVLQNRKQVALRMRAFNDFNRLKRAALVYLATRVSLEKEEITKLSDIFIKLDLNKDGFV
jgi:hypothetical protein